MNGNRNVEQNIGLRPLFLPNNQPGHLDRLLDFLGRSKKIGVLVPLSISVPLKLRIIKYTNFKESVILDKVYATNGIVSSGSTELNQLIDDLIIKSEKYRIRLETIEAFPQLSDTKVEFGMYYIRPPIM
ncbi:DUF5625 family protein [Methylobacter tundripaludum]|nr:DUF5625 family protein [Methylobacter tundripaludum]